MKLQENTVFANRYELQRLLGRGGFSEVWLAKDQWTHLNVAIKVYAPGQGMEEDGMREFCGELAGVYDINHSNLLKPQHVDAWENMPYLIMAYCPNGSCAKLIGKVTEEQMWKMIHDVASGLAYLHEKGLVHQDIKPANVMIDEDGHYLITDFGVSSRARSTLRKSVISSTGGGTTAYMGPERFSKQPAPTKASDIWSLGAMCFEMLEGEVPFGENGGVSQKIGADIPDMNANISDALKFTITKMLQKETWDRPTASTLVEWSVNPARIEVDRSIITSEKEHQENNKAGRPTVPHRNVSMSESETDNKPIIDEQQKEIVKGAKGNNKVWILVGVMAVVICVLCVLLFGGWEDNPVQIEDELIIEEVGDTFQSEVETFTVNDVTFCMRLVEGGTFQMGSENGYEYEQPIHSVTLSGYYIGETEVTQALWKAVMGTTVRQQRDKADTSWPIFGEGDNYPMFYISWNECQEFIIKLNQKTGRRFALPTEAQWEFAARGGNKSQGYEYSGSNNIDEVAWYWDNSSEQTHPVGTKMANELGLYDMSGNVYECCSDWYGDYSSSSQTDSTGPSTGSNRVDRGGGWSNNAGDCRSTDRNYISPDDRYGNLGLRLVLLF